MTLCPNGIEVGQSKLLEITIVYMLTHNRRKKMHGTEHDRNPQIHWRKFMK